VDPERTEAQAEALLATRRILARLKLELLETGEDLAGELTEEDRQLLAHDTEWRAEDDLRIFAEWHGALGTDPGGSATGDGGEASRRVSASLTLVLHRLPIILRDTRKDLGPKEEETRPTTNKRNGKEKESQETKEHTERTKANEEQQTTGGPQKYCGVQYYAKDRR
jgi:hypothetical protein